MVYKTLVRRFVAERSAFHSLSLSKLNYATAQSEFDIPFENSSNPETYVTHNMPGIKAHPVGPLRIHVLVVRLAN